MDCKECMNRQDYDYIKTRITMRDILANYIGDATHMMKCAERIEEIMSYCKEDL